ncbi:hypothetical protein OAJ27_00290 [bacterium]|nr:hypothetical protein [bacterium]
MAIDIEVSGIPAATVQQIIIKGFHAHFKALGITAIETATPTWTHISCEQFNQDSLVLIPFYKKTAKAPTRSALDTSST